MVIRTDEILSILSKLSDESGLKVTVQESVKGGVVAGTACTIGGVLLGPPGLAIGGKVHIFSEGHKILRNLHLTFDGHYIGQN